jgi:hypothetical protein
MHHDAMRTTISIQDSLLKEAKRQAAKDNCSLGDIVNDALRARLVEDSRLHESVAEDRPLRTYGRSGLRRGIDLDDNAALSEAMDEL